MEDISRICFCKSCYDAGRPRANDVYVVKGGTSNLIACQGFFWYNLCMTTLPKTKKKGKWTPPRWTKSIPKGSHGSTDMQKRYWKLISDYIRIKEFYQYGTCISCRKRLDAWNEGQAAHWKSWGASNSWAKFNLDNLALSCANCNRLDDGQVGHNFGEELKRRLGDDILEKIEDFHNSQRGKKMEEHEICLKMEDLVRKFEDLDEQPEYYSRVIGNMVK